MDNINNDSRMDYKSGLLETPIDNPDFEGTPNGNVKDLQINNESRMDYKSGLLETPKDNPDFEGTQKGNVKDDDNPYLDERVYNTYHRRWYVLAINSCIYLLQAMLYNSVGAIATTFKLVYDWKNWQIALFPISCAVATAACVYPTSFVLHSKGIRFTAIISSGLVLLGHVFRILPLNNDLYFYSVCLGSVINGMAGPAVLQSSTSISSTWFPVKQRTLSTSLSMSGKIGIALSFLLGPAFVSKHPCKTNYNVTGGDGFLNCTKEEIAIEKRNVNNLLYMYGGLALALFIAILIYFPAKPPKPPCRSAATTQAMIGRKKFLTDVFAAMKNTKLWILILTAALTLGVSGAWFSIINILWVPLGISQQKIGLIGFLANIAGKLLNPITAKIGDCFPRRLKEILIILNLLCLAATCWAILMSLGYLKLYEIPLYISVITFMSIFSASYPFYFEIGVEMAYPVSAAVTSGFITFVLNLSNAIFLSVFFIPNTNVNWMNWLFGISICVSFLFTCLIKPGYHRLSVDQRNDPIEMIEKYDGVPFS